MSETLVLTDRQLNELADRVACRVLAALAVHSPGRNGETSRQVASGLTAIGSGASGRSGTEPWQTTTTCTDSLLTAEQVAERLGGLKTDWVYAQSRAGRIPTVKLGRYYRYRPDAIEQWIAAKENGA